MGIYLNGTTAYTLYKSETVKPYFIDKTLMLEQLFPLVNEGNNYICITRPRRFGKTVTANMIAAFFLKQKMRRIYLINAKYQQIRYVRNIKTSIQ